MATYSASIRTFLLSHMTNDFGEPNGQGVKNEGLQGDFYHYNEVIDKTYTFLFDKMQLIVPTDQYFEKAFCRAFYNREIGFEVFAQFFIKLEDVLNTTCYNLFKFRNELMEMSINDARETTNITSKSKGSGKSLGLTSTQPQNDLSIIYPGQPGSTIKYADAIGENYNDQDATSTSVGSNTRPLFELLNYYAQITPIDEQIFNICDQKCFMQIF